MFFKMKNWREAEELMSRLAGIPRISVFNCSTRAPTRTVEVTRVVSGRSKVFVRFNTRTPTYMDSYTKEEALDTMRSWL